MIDTFWKIDDRTARIALSPIEAQISLASPELGIQLLRFGVQSNVAGDFLSIAPALNPTVCSLVEGSPYIRQRDLIAKYSSQGEQPLRVEVYWRGIEPPAEASAGIEVQLSVETSSLGIDPAMVVETKLSAERVEQLVLNGQPRLVDFRAASEGHAPHQSDQPSCWLTTLGDGRGSYLEMLQPQPGQESRLTLTGESDTSITIRHQLFADTLEKGVILRARLRGIWFSSSPSANVIAAAYGRFIGSPLPLSV